MGWGSAENMSSKAQAFMKAQKQAVTDAKKRALQNFGNVLGNCISDKDYLKKVVKVKVQPVCHQEMMVECHILTEITGQEVHGG